MDNSPQNKGPYKHYERPSESRVKEYKKPTRWGIIVLILVVIVIALVPIIHTIASRNANQEQAKTSTTISTSTSNALPDKKKSSSKPIVKSSISSQKPVINQKNEKTPANNTNKANTYTVKAGDSLSTIAAQNNMTVEQLMQLNGISDPKSLAAGQVIKLK